MAKQKFQGLVAYNYVVKLVKQEIDNNSIELNKGSSIGLAKDCSFRDVVKKSWLKSKGKSKKSYKKIVSETINDCIRSIEGKKLQKEIKGGGDIDSFHYWEIENALSTYVKDGEKVVIDNSVYGGIPDSEGDISDVEDEISDLLFELNQLSNLRNWDSGSAPTYRLFFDEENQSFNFRLQDNENRDEGLEERIADAKEKRTENQIKDLDRLKDVDLKEKTGGKDQKEKPDKRILEQEIRKKKLEVDKIELEILENKKESLLKTFDRYALMKNKKGMVSTMKKIEIIDNEILKL